VAALAERSAGGQLRLQGRVISLGGERAVEGSEVRTCANVAEADALGVALGDRLLGQGAAAILAGVRAEAAPTVPEP
jgi:porphobilinogen deaminase